MASILYPLKESCHMDTREPQDWDMFLIKKPDQKGAILLWRVKVPSSKIDTYFPRTLLRTTNSVHRLARSFKTDRQPQDLLLYYKDFYALSFILMVSFLT